MPTVTKLRITTTLNNAASIGMHERQGYRRVLETGIFIATAPTPTTDCSALTAAVASSGSLVVRASAAELWRVLSRDATTTTELSDQAAFLLRGTKTFIYDVCQYVLGSFDQSHLPPSSSSSPSGCLRM